MSKEILKELLEIKELLLVIKSNQEKNETKPTNILLESQLLGKTLSSHQTNNSNRVLTSLAGIDQRLYSIEEKIDWVKNGGKYSGDARGPSGIPGL